MADRPKSNFCKFCGAIEKQKYKKFNGRMRPIYLHRCEQGASMMPLEQKAMIEEIVALDSMSFHFIKANFRLFNTINKLKERLRKVKA